MDIQDGLRTTLIVAALRILEDEGAEPSLRAVARSAGVSAMAPYRHFADKASLMEAVVSHGFESLSAALLQADNQPDARLALFGQGMAFIAFAQANPALFRLMYSHQYGNADGGAVRTTYEILARRVAALQPEQARAATLACRSLVQGLATIVIAGRLSPAQPEDVAIALRLLVAGVAAVPELISAL